MAESGSRNNVFIARPLNIPMSLSESYFIASAVYTESFYFWNCFILTDLKVRSCIGVNMRAKKNCGFCVSQQDIINGFGIVRDITYVTNTLNPINFSYLFIFLPSILEQKIRILQSYIYIYRCIPHKSSSHVKLTANQIQSI